MIHHGRHETIQLVEGDRMPRVLLNTEDLATLTVRPGSPFTESLLSLRQLQMRQPSPAVHGWWLRHKRDSLGAIVSPLLVVTPAGTPVDLHTVVGEVSSFDEAMERLGAANAVHLRSELEVAPLPPPGASWAEVWLRDLMDGNRGARRELVGLFREYHRVAIDPHWDAVGAYLDAERVRCGRVTITDGIGGLLATLHPRITWRPPFLHINEPDLESDGPGSRALVADGRSLILVPSVFCGDRPHLLWNQYDDTAPYTLIYPACRSVADASPLWGLVGRSHDRALGELLGQTRAHALEVIASTCTTTELAQRLGVSPATASYHAGVLRGSRLIVTSRDGSAVRHRLTGLGVALLDGNRQP